MIALVKRLFAKPVMSSPVTPYRHWPHNVRLFYPEIYERDRHLPIGEALRAEYPGVIALFPPNASIGIIADYIEANKVDPQ